MLRGGGFTELNPDEAAQSTEDPAEDAAADAVAEEATDAEPAAAADNNPYATEYYADADKAAGVTSITIPAMVEAIDPAFFQLFPNASAITVDPANSTFTSYNGMLFGTNAEDPTDLLLVPEGMEGAAVLPRTLATVPACVFSRCTKLSAIIIPGGTVSARLTSASGILYSENLTAEGEPDGTLTLVAAPAGLGASASIAADCTAIAEGAFWGNDGLKTIVAPAGIAEIPAGSTNAEPATDANAPVPAFNQNTTENATVLTTERAPWEAAGFTQFAKPAEPGEVLAPAPGDSGLTYTLMENGQLSVKWTGDAPASGKRNIPAAATLHGVDYTVSVIEEDAFAGQTELTEIALPDTITTIGASAFDGCTALAQANIPASTATIGERAFAATALQTVTIPTSVATIGEEAFAENPALRTLVALGDAPDVAASALTGCTDLNVYAPYREDGAYAWGIGTPAAGNHLMPYGVQAAPAVIELRTGEQADLFEGGYLEAPGAIEVATSYRSCVSVADNRTVTAKQPGTTPITITLKLNDQLLAATTANAVVTMPEKLAAEEAPAEGSHAEGAAGSANGKTAEGEETEAEPAESSAEEPNVEDAAEPAAPQPLSTEPESIRTRIINLQVDLSTGEAETNHQVEDTVLEDAAFLREVAKTASISEADIMPYATVAKVGTFYVNPNGGKATVKYLYSDFGQSSDAPVYDYIKDATTTITHRNTAWSWTMYITQNGIAVHRWEEATAWVRTNANWDSNSGSTVVADNITYPMHATMTGISKTGYHPTKITNSSGAVLLTNEGLSDSNPLKGSSGFAASTYTPTWVANSYSIQFDKGDGTGTMTNQPMTYDTTATLKASTFTPPKGKHFKQWKTADGKTYTDGQSVKNLTAVNNGTVILTAEYEANTNTVTFKPNFQSGPSSDNVNGTYPNVTATYGKVVPTPTGYVRPSKKGYTFDGWYDGTGSTAKKYLNADGTPAKNGTTSVTWDKTATGTQTLHGHWTASSYTVTLNLNGGSKDPGTDGANLPSSLSVPYYQKFNLSTTSKARIPKAPTAGTGKYTFGGFVVNSDGTGTKYLSSESYGNAGSHETYDVLAVDSTCSAWQTAGTGTIYAKWNYTITYDANGGTGSVAATSATYNKAVTLSSGTNFSYTNKVFTGWNTQADGKGEPYSAGQSVTNMGSRTLYAQWEDKKTKAIFDPNDGNSYDTDRLYSQDLQLNKKTDITATQSAGGIMIVPQRLGYTFEGYFDAKTGGTKYFSAQTTSSGAIASGPTLKAERNWDKTADSTVLYARWTPKIYKITLSNKDATTNGTAEIWVKYNTGFFTGAACEPSQALTKAKLVKPQRTGYVFYGYPNICDGDGNLFTNYTVFSGDTTIDPRWEAKVFKITLNAGTGASSVGTKELYLKYGVGYYSSGTASNGNDTGSVTGNQVGSIVKPERPNYIFNGYPNLIDKDGKVKTGYTTAYTSNTILNASWNPQSFEIRLSTGGGTISDSKWWYSFAQEVYIRDYTIESDAITLPEPEKTGYEFNGWVLNGTSTPIKTVTIPKGSYGKKEYTAKWTARKDIRYKIEYYYQGKDGSWPSSPTYSYWPSNGETDKELTLTAEDCKVNAHSYPGVYEAPPVTAGQERYVENNDDSTTGKYDVRTATIAGDGSTVFKVYYAIQFKVTYASCDINKGTVTPVPDPNDGWRLYNRKVGTAATYTPSVGYEFAGWDPGHNAADAVVKAITYVAQFSAITYHLYLYTNGGTVNVGTTGGFQPGSDNANAPYAQADYYQRYTVESQPIALPTAGRDGMHKIWKDGCRFLGWTGDGIGSTPVMEHTVPAKSTENKRFDAHWEAVPYTLVFDANVPEDASTQVSGAMTSLEVYYGNEHSLPANQYELPGYRFDGWRVMQANGEETTMADGASFWTQQLCPADPNDGTTITLYAVWKANDYQVVFDANKGSWQNDDVTNMPAARTYTFDKASTLPNEIPERAGYEFAGWNSNPDGSGAAYPYQKGVASSWPVSYTLRAVGGETLFAQWEPLSYTVTFDKNLGKHPGDSVLDFPSPSSFTIRYRESVDLSSAEPARVGYEFGGWALTNTAEAADYQAGGRFQHGVKPDGTAMENMPGNVTLYAIWHPIEGGNGFRMNFYKFTDKDYPNSLCAFTSTFTGPVDFELDGEPTPIELPTDRTMRTDRNKVDVPGYFLYGWTWVSDWSGIAEQDRWRYILPIETDMRQIVVDKLGITDPDQRDIDLYAVWQMTYHFDVPGDAAVATLVLDASEKETWRASDVALVSTTPCPVEVEAWSEAKPVAAEVFPSTDLAQVDFLYDTGAGRDNPQLALDGSSRRVQQIGTVPAGTAGAASQLAGQLSIIFRDKNQVNISQKVTPDDAGMVMNGTVWDEPIAQIHWLLSMNPADALTHTLLAAPPSAPSDESDLPGYGEMEVAATPSARPDDPGE